MRVVLNKGFVCVGKHVVARATFTCGPLKLTENVYVGTLGQESHWTTSKSKALVKAYLKLKRRVVGYVSVNRTEKKVEASWLGTEVSIPYGPKSHGSSKFRAAALALAYLSLANTHRKKEEIVA